MIIREQKTSHLDYSNYQLLNKSAVAVGEAIKRYGLPIEHISFKNNGLKGREMNLLINSLSRHYSKLTHLNLAKNKLGYEGAKYLSESLNEMKALLSLDLAENEIGDIGIGEIMKSLKNFGNIEYLDISGNNIGKSSSAMDCAEYIK